MKYFLWVQPFLVLYGLCDSQVNTLAMSCRTHAVLLECRNIPGLMMKLGKGGGVPKFEQNLIKVFRPD